MSRSAVIEKGLQTLHQSLQRQNQSQQEALASISNEAHSNLTKLEKAVFLHFVEFNHTYGQLLDVTVGELQANLTALASSSNEELRMLKENTLPDLHTTLTNETRLLAEERLARCERMLEMRREKKRRGA